MASDHLELVPIFVALFALILILILSMILKWNPHGLPWNWPILGMIPTVFHNFHRIHDRITEMLQASSCTLYINGIWFTNTSFLLTVDPANIHHIMSTHFEKYPKGPEFKYIFDVLGDGIFNSDSDSWRRQRKAAQSLMGHEKFLEFMAGSTMEKVEKGLVPVLDYFCTASKSSVVDLKDLFLRLAFDSTCIMVTGFDLNSLSLEFPDIPFSKAMDDVQEVLFLRHLYPKMYWEFMKKFDVGEAKRMRIATETIDEVIGNLMALKRERLTRAHEMKEDLQHGGADLITWYMINEHEELNCNDKFLRDTILNFMIAGRDAFSVTLSWLFYILSKNPKIVTKIREELRGIIPNQEQERIFAIEELNNLVYLHGALCETLRLYPPIAFEHKSPVEADTLPSGHRVKPNAMILFSLYALGRMRSVWGEDCEEFKPERWITEKGTIKREPSYKFFSFNAGPRTCLGKGVAFSQLKIVSAAIIHNYNIEAVQDDNIIVPAPSVILHMNSGFKVKVSKRWT